MNSLDTLQKIFLIQRKLRQQNEMRGLLVAATGKRRRRGQPARVLPHELHHGDISEVAHGMEIQRNIAYGLGNPAGGTAITGSHIGAGQIIVNRFGHADHAQGLAVDLVAHSFRIG